jgi:hypothetical protein
MLHGLLNSPGNIRLSRLLLAMKTNSKDSLALGARPIISQTSEFFNLVAVNSPHLYKDYWIQSYGSL